jgi:gas vesicle protein
MLLAPKSGSEIRQMISEKTSDLVEGAKTKMGVGTKNNGGELQHPPRPGEPGRF